MSIIITTRTPLRVSFFGGGTDLPDYYSRSYGAVVSTTIKQYVYVTVKPHGSLFEEPFRLNYSKTELVATIDEIENEIARESMRLCGMGGPLYVSTIADLPSGSGLGSSSSFAVGLLNAFHTMRGRPVTPGDLASQACAIEIGVPGKPIGKQDQFAAAYGGLNYIRFDRNERVSITPLTVSPENIEKLFSSFLLFWTGLSRKAEDVLSDQKSRTEINLATLNAMRDLTENSVDILLDPELSVSAFGELLHKSWLLKTALTSRISDDRMNRWYRQGIEAGAYGGKICGAGGGGFMLFCAPPERHGDIVAALSDLKSVAIEYDPLGTRVLFPGYSERSTGRHDPTARKKDLVKPNLAI